MKQRYINAFVLAVCMLLPLVSWAQFSWPYVIQDGTIITEVPERPAGQQSALGLAVDKIPVVRVAFVGLGMRGPDAVERWTHIPGIEVKALCDHERDRAEACQQILRKASMPAADVYDGEDGYKELCRRTDIDLVYIATDWIHHYLVAREALEHGHHVAIEVPSAMNMTEIWSLINLSESKRLHVMMLENCCYDFFELNTLNMAQKGLLGEIIYVQGAYRHELSPYWDEYWKRGDGDKLGWRLDYNSRFRGDLYATHGLGPIAQALNIHRGDRMKTLVAMDTRSFNGKELVKDRTGEDCPDFRNGDHTTTLISTEQGKVIEVHHNVMTPQPYNRMYQLTGTKGFANKYPVEGYALASDEMKKAGIATLSKNYTGHSYLSKEDTEALLQSFTSPLVSRYGDEAREVGGHGGMDFIMDSRLVYCLQNGLPLDIDVYDLAEWCCLAELGSISMDNGNMPVQVPDFTRGEWTKINGFHHAQAAPEHEAEARTAALAFTEQLKARGAKYWEMVAKRDAKAAKKAAKKK
ncbi:MAG: Gfo/Idh/MocA family oxidoreductase [Muribaculaceae bacterium]|nr:Gfo/Idh/MocA family oxidoreductase [Muribaculaceae bacterium]